MSDVDTVSTFNQPLAEKTYEVSPSKLAIVTGTTLAGYATIYLVYLKEGWWAESAPFSFEPLESDMNYASNLDKFGHFYAGALFSEIFAMSYDWTGMSPFASSLWAAATVSLTQILVEVKDGVSPYGYSVWDAAAGCLGSFYAMGKRFVPAMQYVDYKFAYWPNSSLYWDEINSKGGEGWGGDLTGGQGVFVDDYYDGNQTHWLSFKVGKMLPSGARDYYPQWLAFAFGWGLDDGAYKDKNGNLIAYKDGNGKVIPYKDENGQQMIPDRMWKDSRYEYYVALDYDLEAIFRPQKTWSKNLVTILNFVKFPAPAFRFGSSKERTKFFALHPWQLSIGSVTF
ncbi:MAG: YfiM family protein [Fibromonadaceae bacterium]|nr:YfiM family protein [Fibromonadaceae bacterium]